MKNQSDIKLASSFIRDIIDVDGINNLGYESLVKELLVKEDRNNALILYSSKLLIESLNELTDREKSVIEKRYDLTGEGLPQDIESVGNYFGVTRERIRQIQAKAERKLRSPHRMGGKIYILDELKQSGILMETEMEELAKAEKVLAGISLSDIDFSSEETKESLEFIKKVMNEFKERRKENLKQELPQKILEQQRIIAEQESEIDRLKNLRAK